MGDETSSEDSSLEGLQAEIAALKAAVDAQQAALVAQKEELIITLFTGMQHDLLRQACIGTKIDAESLILKLPPFTTDMLKPGGVNRYMQKVKSIEELTLEELDVCHRAHEMGFEFFWQGFKEKYPNLPEFSD